MLDRRSLTPSLPALACSCAGLALLAIALRSHLPADGILALFSGPQPGNPDQLLVLHGLLPRAAIALVAGATLGLATVLFQQSLRNPLADPFTLGTAAGAQLAMALAAIWTPMLLGSDMELVAFGGALASTAVALALAWRRGLSPETIILGGLIVSLSAGSIVSMLIVLNQEELSFLLVLQAGSLAQNGWSQVNWLIPRVVLGYLLALALLRPLQLLALDDTVIRALGVRASIVRLLCLSVAICISAATVSAVGAIGFLGLVAGSMVRACGGVSLRRQLLWTPATGAGLLLLADQLSQIIPSPWQPPAGSVTALLGGVAMLFLLPGLQTSATAVPLIDFARSLRPNLVITGIFLGAAASVAAALLIGHGGDGFGIAPLDELGRILPWRVPRTLAAVSGGILLAVAGLLLQRLTGNPLASPESLGVSAGSTLGVVILLLAMPGPDRMTTLSAAAMGAFASLAVLLGASWRQGFSPQRLLLAGVTIATIGSTLATLALTGGEGRLGFLLNWISGSTYRATLAEAEFAACAAALALAASPLLSRWLSILPLGKSSALGLGVHLTGANFVLLMIAASASAVATLTVGPLSFIGLMAPSLARMLGLARPAHQLAGAAMLGGAIMAVSDLVGRTAAAPWQIPSGLVAACVGGPFCLWLLWQRR